MRRLPSRVADGVGKVLAHTLKVTMIGTGLLLIDIILAMLIYYKWGFLACALGGASLLVISGMVMPKMVGKGPYVDDVQREIERIKREFKEGYTDVRETQAGTRGKEAR